MAQGHCMACERDNVTGELVNEVHTNSGGGWTNVLCDACKAAGRTAWRPRRPTDPHDYPVQSGSRHTKYGRE